MMGGEQEEGERTEKNCEIKLPLPGGGGGMQPNAALLV